MLRRGLRVCHRPPGGLQGVAPNGGWAAPPMRAGVLAKRPVPAARAACLCRPPERVRLTEGLAGHLLHHVGQAKPWHQPGGAEQRQYVRYG